MDQPDLFQPRYHQIRTKHSSVKAAPPKKMNRSCFLVDRTDGVSRLGLSTSADATGKKGTHVLRSTQPMTCRPPFTPLAALNNLVRVALSQPLCSTRSPRTARPWLMSASSCDSALSTNASSLSAYSADVDGPRWGLLVVYCDWYDRGLLGRNANGDSCVGECWAG